MTHNDLEWMAELTSRNTSGAMNGGCTDYKCDCHDFLVKHQHDIALACNAFDVMMRRGWTAVRVEQNTWSVSIRENDLGAGATTWIGYTFPDKQWNPQGKRLEWPDPFTALVEADKWYRENIDNKGD